MNRKISRETTMKLLYQMSINKENYLDIINNYKENTEEKLDNVDFDYIEKVLKGVEENKESIDEKIQEHSTKWKINRISKINLAILRIATYEIMCEEEIPNKVSVNEAIELAKKYSEDKSPAFVNGVLGNMIQK
ncbi:transcription antitermination factor NusB [Haloimpatiens sp. FM7330]|uniref:transcription antitermination factor NusB n=1 Tax=Haloimpatiens sp. FM7330 TaxID=3298610 RepID=UPI003632FE0F